jgi:hypothetical protein
MDHKPNTKNIRAMHKPICVIIKLDKFAQKDRQILVSAKSSISRTLTVCQNVRYRRTEKLSRTCINILSPYSIQLSSRPRLTADHMENNDDKCELLCFWTITSLSFVWDAIWRRSFLIPHLVECQ